MAYRRGTLSRKFDAKASVLRSVAEFERDKRSVNGLRVPSWVHRHPDVLARCKRFRSQRSMDRYLASIRKDAPRYHSEPITARERFWDGILPFPTNRR